MLIVSLNWFCWSNLIKFLHSSPAAVTYVWAWSSLTFRQLKSAGSLKIRIWKNRSNFTVQNYASLAKWLWVFESCCSHLNSLSLRCITIKRFLNGSILQKIVYLNFLLVDLNTNTSILTISRLDYHLHQAIFESLRKKKIGKKY